MPVIWCSISAHGFGHAAQVVPILNQLGRRFPGTKIILRTGVSPRFFEERLEVPWELSASVQDVGCIQDGPLHIDFQKTWKAYATFHQEWSTKVVREAQVVQSHAPDLILSNISHLAIEAGAYSGIPTVAIASLSWDKILGGLEEGLPESHVNTIEHIRQSYAKADLCIQIHPALQLDAFPNVVDVGPIGVSCVQEQALERPGEFEEDRLLVLVGFGGVPVGKFPFPEMEAMKRYRFVIDGKVPSDYPDVWPIAKFSYTFKELLNRVDILLTKPGYGSCIESVNSGMPVVYVRRFNFADEQMLIDYLHRYGRAQEMSRDDFFAGNWTAALDAGWSLPLPKERPPQSGVDEAVEALMNYLV